MLKSKVFLLVSLVCISIVGIAQRTTSSPYSRYGIGTLLSESFFQNFAMGGTGIGLRSNRNINFINPASYSSLSLVTFEAGFTNTALTLNDGTQSENLNYPYISHIAFGIPVIKNKWGMSFGMLPYSNVGYDYINTVNDSLVGDITYIQNGNGGLTKAYFGNAVQLIPKTNIDPLALILKPFAGPRYSIEVDSTGTETKVYNKRVDSLIVDKSTPLSFGVNGYFMFGSTNRDEKVIYGDLSNALNLWALQQTAVADFGVDFGVQYQKKYTVYKKNKVNKYRITLGATYAMANDLSSKYSDMVRTFTGTSEFGTVKDTISLIVEAEDVVQLPQEFGVGISFEQEKKWVFNLDYSIANWGTIAVDNFIFDYNSNYSISTGFQIIPDYDNDHQYLKRIAYRFGARYNTSYVTINNQELTEYGITFGLGLPMRKGVSAWPQLNLGFEYGKRGEAKNDLIEETFFKFNIGITINDRWFVKRKYN